MEVQYELCPWKGDGKMRSIIKSDGEKFFCITEFDKENLQEEYLYMAKRVDNGEYVVGNIVVRKPWYSCESLWTYYIYYNNYDSAGLNGGVAVDELARIEVDRNTIEPYTQTAAIKNWQSSGREVLVVKDISLCGIYKTDDERNFVCRIGIDDKIPIELWK